MSSNESNKLNTVFMSTISSLIEQLSNHMNSASNIPTDPNDVTPDLTIKIGNYSLRSTHLFYERACALAADTSVKETISQKIVAYVAANTKFKKVTQSIVSSGVQQPIQSSQTSESSVAKTTASQGIGVANIKAASKFGALRTHPNDCS